MSCHEIDRCAHTRAHSFPPLCSGVRCWSHKAHTVPAPCPCVSGRTFCSVRHASLEISFRLLMLSSGLMLGVERLAKRTPNRYSKVKMSPYLLSLLCLLQNMDSCGWFCLWCKYLKISKHIHTQAFAHLFCLNISYLLCVALQ